MELARFVRITCDRSPSGTGYLIARHLVLTARHVVEGATRIEVLYDGADGKQAAAEAIGPHYLGEGDLDIAVLRVETALDIPSVPLAPERFRGDRPWRSKGWAEAAREVEADDARQVDHMSSLAGKAYEFSSAAQSFEAGVNDPPAGVEWWKGASGAPVFLGDRSPERLVGVIASGRRPFNGKRLHAVPLSAAWNDPRFLAAIEYDQTREERRQRRRGDLISSLAIILARNESASHAIAAELSAWQEALARKESGGFLGLATALCEAASWRNVIEALDRAHLKLIAQEGEAPAGNSEVIVRIVERLLPEVYYSTAGHVLPDGEGSVLELPVETETLAEISMAAIDGRCLTFDDVKEKRSYPGSPLQIDPDHPQVPNGFDFSTNAALGEFLKVTARWLGLDPKDFKTLSSPERIDELAQRIDREIEADVRRSEPRHYFVYRSEFAQSHRAFLERLELAVPSLKLVALTGKTLNEERDACEPLRAILFRSYERRSKKGRRRL